MKRDDDPKLWDLLGRAAEPKISPFFARNILREIRKADDWKTLRGWLGPRRLIPVTGIALVLIAFSFLRLQAPVAVAPFANPTFEKTFEAMEYEVVADLEELFSSDEGNLLEEAVLL